MVATFNPGKNSFSVPVLVSGEKCLGPEKLREDSMSSKPCLYPGGPGACGYWNWEGCTHGDNRSAKPEMTFIRLHHLPRKVFRGGVGTLSPKQRYYYEHSLSRYLKDPAREKLFKMIPRIRRTGELGTLDRVRVYST
jgi:hypothetical protein